jgi:hypothetical protein
MRYHPELIKADLFPFENDLDIEQVIKPLIADQKVIIFEHDQKTILQINNWTQHQKIQRPQPSKFHITDDELSAIIDRSLNDHGSICVGTGNREQGTGNRDRRVVSGSKTRSIGWLALDDFNNQAGANMRSEAYVTKAKRRAADGATLEDFAAVTRWALKCPHDAPKRLRDGGHANPDTLWRASKWPKYLLQARQWLETQKAAHDSPQRLITSEVNGWLMDDGSAVDQDGRRFVKRGDQWVPE